MIQGLALLEKNETSPLSFPDKNPYRFLAGFELLLKYFFSGLQ